MYPAAIVTHRAAVTDALVHLLRTAPDVVSVRKELLVAMRNTLTLQQVRECACLPFSDVSVASNRCHVCIVSKCPSILCQPGASAVTRASATAVAVPDGVDPLAPAGKQTDARVHHPVKISIALDAP
jgi:hypothetical protein